MITLQIHEPLKRYFLQEKHFLIKLQLCSIWSLQSLVHLQASAECVLCPDNDKYATSDQFAEKYLKSMVCHTINGYQLKPANSFSDLNLKAVLQGGYWVYYCQAQPKLRLKLSFLGSSKQQEARRYNKQEEVASSKQKDSRSKT